MKYEGVDRIAIELYHLEWHLSMLPKLELEIRQTETKKHVTSRMNAHESTWIYLCALVRSCLRLHEEAQECWVGCTCA